MRPEDVQPPGRWAQRLAIIMGVVFLGLGVATSWKVGDVREERGSVEHALHRAAKAPDGTGDRSHRALLAAYRKLGARAAQWERRRLGLILAGIVLVLGGVSAGGLYTLYEKTDWVVIERKDDT